MAFQLKANESIAKGLTRNVKQEIEKAMALAAAKGDPTEAVHEVRKGFKKVRAALRLAREELGDETYRAENYAFRDAARPLTEVRDAQMLVETFDKLKELAGEVDAPALAKVRDALVAHEKEVTERVLKRGKALAQIKEFAARSLVRVAHWNIQHDGWASIEDGFRRVYRNGHRAFARAMETPSVLNLHEWRKQTKYLWHELQLLEPTWTHEDELGDRFHALSRLLGDDHDLAVLRETLAADPLAYGGHRLLKALFVPLDRQREALEKEAFALGQELDGESAKTFTARFAPPSSDSPRDRSPRATEAG